MNRILLIEHHDEILPPDRVRLFLERSGRDYEVLRLYAGDTLPDTVEGIGAAVLYGGPQEAYETVRYPYLGDEHRFIRDAVAADLPLLGLCLGAQNIAYAHGACVEARADQGYEFGYYNLTPTDAGRGLFPDGPVVMPQWHWHNAALPEGAELLASSAMFANQAYRLGSAWGFQFHPEVTPELMRLWQGHTSAPWTAPGAQTLAEQQALMAAHDPAIDRWFNRFLAEFFA